MYRLRAFHHWAMPDFAFGEIITYTKENFAEKALAKAAMFLAEKS